MRLRGDTQTGYRAWAGAATIPRPGVVNRRNRRRWTPRRHRPGCGDVPGRHLGRKIAIAGVLAPGAGLRRHGARPPNWRERQLTIRAGRWTPRPAPEAAQRLRQRHRPTAAVPGNRHLAQRHSGNHQYHATRVRDPAEADPRTAASAAGAPGAVAPAIPTVDGGRGPSNQNGRSPQPPRPPPRRQAPPDGPCGGAAELANAENRDRHGTRATPT